MYSHNLRYIYPDIQCTCMVLFAYMYHKNSPNAVIYIYTMGPPNLHFLRFLWLITRFLGGQNLYFSWLKGGSWYIYHTLSVWDSAMSLLCFCAKSRGLVLFREQRGAVGSGRLVDEDAAVLSCGTDTGAPGGLTSCK